MLQSNLMKAVKILRDPRPKKDKYVNFRMSEEAREKLYAKLKKDGLKPQEFFDQIVEAYLEGKIT